MRFKRSQAQRLKEFGDPSAAGFTPSFNEAAVQAECPQDGTDPVCGGTGPVSQDTVQRCSV